MTDYTKELIETANLVASRGKGILAADESTGTIGKRFAPINVENNEENRRRYRQLLVKTEGLEKFISGVILYEETLYQKTDEGELFVDVLKSKGIAIGIKVDKGPRVVANDSEETFTQGFDDLGARCAKYYEAGARFAKWRAVLRINQEKGYPSNISIKENANGLARYAKICQMNGLVPIVEPEVLMDGPHNLQVAEQFTERIIVETYKALHDAGVVLEGTLLKPNMVCPGKGCETKYTAGDIGYATITCLRRSVPAAVPGINFLSGGLSEENASLYLSAINAQKGVIPWNVSFSYGRALQASCLKAWLGNDDNIAAAQKVLLTRAEANSLAAKGEYLGIASLGASQEEIDAAKQSLFVSNYSY